jgi:hypothetical protein
LIEGPASLRPIRINGSLLVCTALITT